MAVPTLASPVAAGTGPPSIPAARVVVGAAILLSVLLRLPFLGAPAGPDEAGFLQVAAQWAPGGGSLYGHYWVDRPPLLITLFGVAHMAGGLVALRALGCIAVAVTVAACARGASRLGGASASGWAAVLAAALLVSPLVGSQEVNGELLAAPFVAVGVAALVEAAQTHDPRRSLRLATVGGAMGMSAILVKQNIIDVAVFAVVLVVAGIGSGRIGRRVARQIAIGASSGAVAALVAVAAWTVAHGTSLSGVLDAMYPFRLAAARVVAAGGSQYAAGRAGHIAVAWLVSGLAVLTVIVVVAVARRPTRDPALLGLAATVGYDTVSVALGGGYWSHYLVEMVVPVAVAAGVLAARGQHAPRVVAAIAVAVSAGAAVTATPPTTSTAQQVGTAIASAARPSDTLTTLYGQPDVNLAARLPSPYAHLWSLPVKTLDPQLTELNSVLAGPDAPTWLVVTHRIDSWGLATDATQTLVERDYHPVATIAGVTVYLRDGVHRDPLSTAP